MQQMYDILALVIFTLIVFLMYYFYRLGKSEGKREAYREIGMRRRDASYMRRTGR